MINRVYTTTYNPTPMPGRDPYYTRDTEIAPIKAGTFHYSAAAMNNNAIGKGGVFSSYIEFEYYINSGITLTKGQAIMYAQETDVDSSFGSITPNRICPINVFFVTEIKKRRNTYYVMAYDMFAKLDVDFSATLKANEANFPMTVDGIIALIDSLTSTLDPWWSEILQQPTYWQDAKVKYFYADGITARDVLRWIGELTGSPIIADVTPAFIGERSTISEFNDVGSDNWDAPNNYIVCPDDGTYSVNGSTAINVWYKEHGFEVGGAIPTYDGAEIVGADGTILGSYYTATPASNIIRITGNLIAENIIEFGYMPNSIPTVRGTYNDLAEEILTNANKVQSFSSAKVNLFPFRAPYAIGKRMYCVDTYGNTYTVPIFVLDITDEIETIGTYLYAQDDVSAVESQTQTDGNLSAQINELKSMVNPLRTDTLTDTTNAYGNIFTTLDESCTILSAIRTGNTASICTPFWNESTGVWGIHVAGMGGAAVTSTSVAVKIAYFEG